MMVGGGQPTVVYTEMTLSAFDDHPSCSVVAAGAT